MADNLHYEAHTLYFMFIKLNEYKIIAFLHMEIIAESTSNRFNE